MAGYGNYLKNNASDGYNYSTGSIRYLFDSPHTYLISVPFTASNIPTISTTDDYYSKFGYRTPSQIDDLFENNIVKISTILPNVKNDYYSLNKATNLSVIKYDGEWIGKYQKIEPWHAIYVTTDGMVDSTISGSLIPGNYKTSKLSGDAQYGVAYPYTEDKSFLDVANVSSSLDSGSNPYIQNWKNDSGQGRKYNGSVFAGSMDFVKGKGYLVKSSENSLAKLNHFELYQSTGSSTYTGLRYQFKQQDPKNVGTGSFYTASVNLSAGDACSGVGEELYPVRYDNYGCVEPDSILYNNKSSFKYQSSETNFTIVLPCYKLDQSITGHITTSYDSPAITGSGTAFASEFVEGDAIKINGRKDITFLSPGSQVYTPPSTLISCSAANPSQVSGSGFVNSASLSTGNVVRILSGSYTDPYYSFHTVNIKNDTSMSITPNWAGGDIPLSIESLYKQTTHSSRYYINSIESDTRMTLTTNFGGSGWTGSLGYKNSILNGYSGSLLNNQMKPIGGDAIVGLFTGSTDISGAAYQGICVGANSWKTHHMFNQLTGSNSSSYWTIECQMSSSETNTSGYPQIGNHANLKVYNPQCNRIYPARLYESGSDKDVTNTITGSNYSSSYAIFPNHYIKCIN